jgi:dihydrolipoamide dehydrogenase
MTKKIVIIGGGPAGYVGAIRAAQLGAEVTLVEKQALGGTCANVGCIPTKALLASVATLEHLRHASTFGVTAEKIAFDWQAVQKRKERVVKKSVAGVGFLMKSRKVTVIDGTAKLAGRNSIAVKNKSGSEQTLQADGILIATGSESIMIPIPGHDLPDVIDSTGALALQEIPASMLIIGGGVIGCEMASVYAAFGTKVTVVELLPQIIPNEDPEAVRVLHNSLVKAGIAIHTESKVLEIAKAEKGVTVKVPMKDGTVNSIPAEKVLMSVGRRGCTKDIGLDAAGVAAERGFIKVDGKMETNVPGIFAAGDCIGGWLLAHVASREAEVAVENMLGHGASIDYDAIPRCVYTHPEIASVGVLNKPDVLVGKFPFSANGKANCIGELDGFVKVVAEKGSQRVIGGVIVGASATELIAEIGLAVSMKAKLSDIAGMIHSHPTLHESVHEAALNALGRALHLP